VVAIVRPFGGETDSLGQALSFESSCNTTTFDLCSYATKRYARRALLIVRHFCTPSARAIDGSWAKTPVSVHTRE
jgi:hypothetical protein